MSAFAQPGMSPHWNTSTCRPAGVSTTPYTSAVGATLWFSGSAVSGAAAAKYRAISSAELAET